jgi:hypothetical protein
MSLLAAIEARAIASKRTSERATLTSPESRIVFAVLPWRLRDER